ncbi:MAG: hypothetical protein DRH24_18535 [Deltaproteobacteria bacterium]|nr:MAG: hypothetical protein DRH24_18535 [Deltaproteobacteria bacterium]
MLQQTHVNTVLPFYRAFFLQFPNVRSLAQADINNVLKVWEGMGYYAPARNLYQAAKTVVEKHDGKYSLEGFEIASKQLMVGWSGIY